MKYLYCVIPTNHQETFNVQGINGEVHTLPYRDISLVVSDSAQIPFTSLTKEELLNLLLIHQTTIEKIMSKYSVIPLKFGTFLDGENETSKIMEKGYPLFKKLLQDLEDKIELNVVATWANLNDVFKKIGETEEIVQLKNEILVRPLSERVNSSIELGKMVKNLLDKMNKNIVDTLITALKDESLAHLEHAVLNDGMICNIAFLINKNNKEEFDQVLEQLDIKFKEEINFKIVGPLPPYSFATFEIKKLNSEEITKAKVFLGVTGEPNPEEIKQTYYSLAQEMHPDKNPENLDAVKQFEELKKAFDVLYQYASNNQDLLLIQKLAWEEA